MDNDDVSVEDDSGDELLGAIAGVGYAVSDLVDQFGYDASVSVVANIGGIPCRIKVSVTELASE